VPAMAAIDLGAQSGRVTLGNFDGRQLTTTEIHRFPNIPVKAHDTLYWDTLRLYADTLAGLRAAARRSGAGLDSVGVDAWGLDFGLLDRFGRLVQNPVHHRDHRTDTAMGELCASIPPREVYQLTGTQLMPFNSLFQLSAMASTGDPALDCAQILLMIPDLFHYWLCGARACERTVATTTQCYDIVGNRWAWGLLDRAGVPARLFGPVVEPATDLGALRGDVTDAIGVSGTRVIAPAGHDTASAVAAIPLVGEGTIYISSGTWSLVGLESTKPMINDRTFAANLTNEGGVGGSVRILRNVVGLWILQQCRDAWSRLSGNWEFDDLVTLAQSAPRFAAFIDPNDPVFLPPGDMPGRISGYCVASGQQPPQDPACVMRCVLESLALKYRQTIDLLRTATGIAPRAVHVVGGGVKNKTLCQWTADATGLPVMAGPAEASTIGNLLVQAMGLGELGSLAEARQLVRDSFPVDVYEPRGGDAWEAAYHRFTLIAGTIAPDSPRPDQTGAGL
jgi:rhamnulokinase